MAEFQPYIIEREKAYIWLHMCPIFITGEREKNMEKESKMKNEIYKELKVSFQSMEERIKDRKEYKEQLNFKIDLYNKCLDDHLLDKGSKLIREHLEETKKEVKAVDKQIEDLIVEKDAYRIELEVFEAEFRD